MKEDKISISYQNYDIIFKSLTGMFGNQTLEFYGLKTAPIVRAEPTELSDIQIDVQSMDFVFYLADDSYLHVEFQTTYSIKDIERFKLYDALLYEKKKKPIHTAVIYGPGITDTVTFFDHGSLKYNTYAVYMHNYDGDTIYKMLEVLKMTQVLRALYKEFKEEGKAEGKAEGLMIGKAEGKREIICKTLMSRYGIKSLELQKKIEKLDDLNILDETILKTFSSPSLEEAGSLIEEALNIQEKINSL